tara:strand:+ start:868 stop:1083 length:216 start_codon:yes stop_codon:yes gene_type:complete
MDSNELRLTMVNDTTNTTSTIDTVRFYNNYRFPCICWSWGLIGIVTFGLGYVTKEQFFMDCDCICDYSQAK